MLLGNIFKRAPVVFGLWCFLGLNFYFDYLNKSLELTSSSIEPNSFWLIPFGAVLILVAISFLISLLTCYLSEKRFIQLIVGAGFVFNISSLIAIGEKSNSSFISAGLALGALIATIFIKTDKIKKVIYACALIAGSYTLINQAYLSYSGFSNANPHLQKNENTTAIKQQKKSPPSIYVVVIEEMSLSLVNHYANFMSLPNFSKLAKQGVYFPRAYAVADETKFSIPSIFTGKYPPKVMYSHIGFSNYWLTHDKNIVSDLQEQGYRIKVFNDLFNICKKTKSCSKLKSSQSSDTLISKKDLTQILWKYFLHQASFGSAEGVNMGALFQGQGKYNFQLDHDKNKPQFVYIHMFDSHHNYKKNRNGTTHDSLYQSYREVTKENAPKVAANNFEQILWTDQVSGKLVDELLAIPKEERIILLVSDHGISWREYPYHRQTGWINSSQIHVPAVIIAPSLKPEINPELMPLIDVYPTLAELINKHANKQIIKIPADIDGISAFSSQAKRKNRKHIALSRFNKYKLNESAWILEEKSDFKMPGKTKLLTPDAPVPAHELANNQQAADLALQEALNPKPIPDFDETRAQNKSNDTLSNVDEKPMPALFEHGYKGYNIIRYDHNFYAVLQNEGEFIYSKFKAGEYNLAVSASNDIKVKAKIDKIKKKYPHIISQEQDEPKLYEEGYKGFNILTYKDTFYAIPQGEGAFDLSKVKNHEYSNSPEATSPADIHAAIDKIIEKGMKIAEATVMPTLYEEGYKGFNILTYKDKFYAIPQGEGAFDISKVKNHEYSNSPEATSPADIHAALDKIIEKGIKSAEAKTSESEQLALS